MEDTQQSYVSKVWQDRDIVGYEDANRWESGIDDAHTEISAIKEVLESLVGSDTDTDTQNGVIDDSVEADNSLASTYTWSVKKIAEQLSGKVDREELQEVVTEAVQEAMQESIQESIQESVQESVQEAVQEEISNLDGLVSISSTAPTNLDTIWLDTEA